MDKAGLKTIYDALVKEVHRIYVIVDILSIKKECEKCRKINNYRSAFVLS